MAAEAASIPSIESLSPNPLGGGNTPASLTIEGRGFLQGCRILLRDGRTTDAYTVTNFTSFASNRVRFDFNFSAHTSDWEIVLINPDGTASGTNTLRVLAPQVMPVIESVHPNPVPGKSSGQYFLIQGRDFVYGCKVNLTHVPSGNLYSDRKKIHFTSDQIILHVNFTAETADWDVEVINPSGLSSGKTVFRVGEPDKSLVPLNETPLSVHVVWLLAGLAMCAVVCVAAQRRRRRELRLQRELVGQDLHDRLGANVTLLGVHNNAVQRVAGDCDLDPELRVRLSKFGLTLQNAQADLDDLIWVTRSDDLKLNGLINRIRACARNTLAAANVEPVFQFPAATEDRRVDRRTCHHLLMIVSEAVINAVKHADATVVTVSLDLATTHTELTVTDNGVGLDGDQHDPDGHGLKNMRKRAEELGGELRITGPPKLEKGARISVRIPAV